MEDEGPHEEEEGGAWRQLRERPPRPPTSIPWGVTAAAAAALAGAADSVVLGQGECFQGVEAVQHTLHVCLQPL